MSREDNTSSNMSITSRICIGVLAVEWIVFGMMHFTQHDAAIAQMPDVIPFKSFLVNATGIAEVAAGISVLVPKYRRMAALASFVILVVISPAAFKIALDPAATPMMVQPAKTIFRAIVIPNILIMGFCSYILWRNQEPL